MRASPGRFSTRSPPDDREQGRQQREAREQGGGNADRRHRPERVGRAGVGQQQHEHRRHDRAAARQHSGPGAAERAGHRLVLVLDPVQLLAIAADEQQAVVGAHAEHEHDEDPGRARADRVARLRVQVDEARGQLVGEPDHEDRDDGDQGRPVDRPEQDQHEEDGGEQQLGVELAEDLLEVDPQPEVAGDVDVEPVAAAADQLAGLLAPVGDLVEVERDRDDGVGGVAVLGDEPGRGVRPERHLRGLGDGDRVVDVPRVLGDPLTVRLGQPAVPPVDDQADRRLAAWEALLQEPLHLGGLGLGGKEARRLVARDIRELGAEGRHDRDRDEPQDEHDPLGAASGDEGGESRAR
jgi:hypothetical protein